MNPSTKLDLRNNSVHPEAASTSGDSGILHKSSKLNQSGFTIIEILLAMTFFTFILMIVLAAYTQMLRAYRAGISLQRTQEIARDIVTRISDDFHRSNSIEVVDDAPYTYVCLGSIQYRYKHLLKIQVDAPGPNLARFVVPSGTECGHLNVQRGQAMVDDRFIVSKFDVTTVSNAGIDYGMDLDLSVSTKTGDLLNDDLDSCNPAESGSQFCSVANVKTAIGLGD